MTTKTPTLIKNLYGEDFFVSKKSLSDVEKEVNSKHYFPDKAAICIALNNAKYLKRRGKKGNYKYFQKEPSRGNSEELDVIYFESGKPRTSRKKFVELLQCLKGTIKICDPYINEDSLEALEKIKDSKIRFLTSGFKQNIKVSIKDLQDFKAENSNIEIKGINSDCLHDRYILTDKVLYLLGHGFSIRKKESFVIVLPEKIAGDLIQSLSSTFDIRWKNQNNKILC